jgi:hypothetical protein
MTLSSLFAKMDFLDKRLEETFRLGLFFTGRGDRYVDSFKPLDWYCLGLQVPS